MNLGDTTMKKGMISLKTARGWEQWGIGTFRDALRAVAETGNRCFRFRTLGTREVVECE
jgi:hypothetical protein